MKRTIAKELITESYMKSTLETMELGSLLTTLSNETLKIMQEVCNAADFCKNCVTDNKMLEYYASVHPDNVIISFGCLEYEVTYICTVEDGQIKFTVFDESRIICTSTTKLVEGVIKVRNTSSGKVEDGKQYISLYATVTNDAVTYMKNLAFSYDGKDVCIFEDTGLRLPEINPEKDWHRMPERIIDTNLHRDAEILMFDRGNRILQNQSMPNILASGIRDIFETYTLSEILNKYTWQSIQSMCKVVCGNAIGTTEDMANDIQAELGLGFPKFDDAESSVNICDDIAVAIAKHGVSVYLQISKEDRVLRTMIISRLTDEYYQIKDLGSGVSKNGIYYLSLLILREGKDFMSLAIQFNGKCSATHNLCFCSETIVQVQYVYNADVQGFVPVRR